MKTVGAIALGYSSSRQQCQRSLRWMFTQDLEVSV